MAKRRQKLKPIAPHAKISDFKRVTLNMFNSEEHTLDFILQAS
jgi:hypothetical protein